MADDDQLWSVQKLKNYLLRRNVSTNGRKTDLIERMMYPCEGCVISMVPYHGWFATSHARILEHRLETDILSRHYIMGETSDAQKRDTTNINYWDIFRTEVSEETLTTKSNITDKIFKTVKCIAYILFFAIVFGGTIVSKASLQILTDQLHLESKTNYTTNLAKDAISYYLLFIISLPDGVQLLLSLLRFLFGKRESPSIVQLVVVIIRECVHLFCLASIVFKVLPILNAIEACAYLSGIPLVPSILNSISHRQKCLNGGRKMCKQMLNILSVLLQATAVCAVPIHKLINDQIGPVDTFLMFFAAVFVSVSWFETYFKYSTNSIFRKLLAYEDRQATQTVSSLITSFFRVVLAVALFPTFLCPGVHEPTIAFSEEPLPIPSSTISPINCITIAQKSSTENTTIHQGCYTNYADAWLLTPFLVHFFTTIVFFYTAVVVVRLCMDKACFCVALSLGTPVYVTCIIVARLFNNNNWISATWMSKEDSTDAGVYTMLIVFIIAWFSQLWTCRHIWFSSHDRMTVINRLFVLPHYYSPIADLSLLHSRRQLSEESFNNTNLEDGSIQTKVYICATMWHENRIEMKQILKTLFRLDLDQAARHVAKHDMPRKEVNRDYYEFEAHIMFDDAMETTENKRGPNEFVKQLIEIITEAGVAVHNVPINLSPPDKNVTPYGGRLTWNLPGQNKLVVHLKDKDKIRHKKRWSQIMYLYYLIGYKLVNKEIHHIKSTIKDFQSAQSIFEKLPSDIVQQAENTYVMALDGDVDFSPEALQLLLDKMKKNPKVGATCGRIKPGGSGPVVWYQKFEYAIGHWLQKSAEHVFGCVLCSPGCFSLFRAKALMDDNIMRTYANLPTEPKHYIQYDQGEDRWLCTLMLQQGYRIEYCAAAEALTFAPEDFREFFNQRRRWLPSTMANTLDLLSSYKRTTRNNSNISYLYIIYQIILFASSVLGPSTVLLAMLSAVRTVFGTSVIVAYIVTYGPTIIFIFICLKFKSQTQLTVAMVLSAVYAMLMMAVVVGTIVSITKEGPFTPPAVFMYILVGVFFIAGLFHPHELTDLFWGVLYFICIPAGYLFLIIYAICNLNNVSWGTRETQTAVLVSQEYTTQKKKKTEGELESVSGVLIDDFLNQVKAKRLKDATCADLIPSIFRWINNLIILRSLESVVNISKNTDNDGDGEGEDFRNQMRRTCRRNGQQVMTQDDAVDDQSWADENKALNEDEITFWKDLIANYLEPLNQDKKKEKAVAESLKDFRNKVAFAFFFVNGLWLVIMTAMNEVKALLNIQIPIVGTIEPLGLLFLVIFAILLILQFIGMIKHRYGTFLHLLASTNLKNKGSDPKSIIEKIKGLSSSSAQSDFTTSNNRQTDSGLSESDVSPRQLEDNHENYEIAGSKKTMNMGKSIKKPRANTGDKPLNLRKTFRQNVQQMKSGRDKE